MTKKNKYGYFLKRLASQSSAIFPEKLPDGYVCLVKENGAVEGPKLPNEMIEELVCYANDATCYADRNKAYGFKLDDYELMCEKLNKRVLVAQYSNLEELPLIKAITEDPFILAVAGKYLEVEPKLVGVNLWWTFPEASASEEDKNKHAHVFHYDLDDVKFIKFFFYLTDVTELDGPHVYVEGSNNNIKYKNTLIKSKRFTDEEVELAYGRDAIKVVTGPAGSCLIEDTITLHKGTTGERNPRLMLQLQYAIFDYGLTDDY